MQRYLIEFSYDGSRYHGWQIQPNGITVQAVLQECLSLLLRCEVEVVGAGRTDAGVHARKMFAHFDLDSGEGDSCCLFSCSDLTYKLNRMLPCDISVKRIIPVDRELHARFSATKRTYHYYLHTEKDPFRRHYSWETHYSLDFDKMNEAAAYLIDVHDFASFCKTGADVKTTICHVMTSRWINDGGGCWHFEISADRFLRNMVRAVVGTLVEVGRGRMSIDEFKTAVASCSRSAAGESMPAHALFLVDVAYSEELLLLRPSATSDSAVLCG